MKQQVIRFSIFVLVAVGVVGLSGCASLDASWGKDRQRAGALEFDEKRVPGERFEVGDFRVTWETERGGRLVVSHQKAPERVLWSSVPGEAFVAAGIGEERVEEARAMFFFDDKLSAVTERQSVDSMDMGDEGILQIAGMLSGGGEDPVGYAVLFREAAPGHLQFRTLLYNSRYNRTFLTYASDAEEHFFGFGEQFSHFDLKGRRVPIFISEQGIGRGAQPLTWGANVQAKAGGDWWTSYACVPQYITNRNRGLLLENHEYSVFDLRKPERVQVQVWSGNATGRILYGDSPLGLIETTTLFTGRMRALPDWATKGAIVGMQGGTEKVRGALKELYARGTPIGAVWLQDWEGQRKTTFGKQLWWNWELDEDRYPGWNAFVHELDARGIAVMTYVNPFLADVSEKENAKRNLFQEAMEKDFLVKRPDGEPYLILNTSFSAAMVDLTNPQAWDWMKKVIRDEVIGVGARGWMADFGEALPYDAVLYSGEPASRVHNGYPELWAKLNREVVEETGTGEDFVFFMRSGFTRSPRFATLFWLGDQMVGWDEHDGIKTAVTGLLSSGISGYALNHSDIGGYTTITNPLATYHRSEELLLRWMDLAAFNVVFRTHEGNQPDSNVQFYSNERTLDHFSRMAKVYGAWDFYRRELIEETEAKGLPVVRHPWVQFPEDEALMELTHEQFMVGDTFMVAPVLDEGEEQVKVYLPKGRWVHVWSGKSYGNYNASGWVTVPAPMGEPGVFFPEGSEVGEQFVKNLEDAGVL